MACSFAACHDRFVLYEENHSLTSVDSASADDDVVIDADRLSQVIRETLIASGAVPAEAAIQADLLVEGDLRGQHSHGVRRLPVLLARLRNGLVTSGLEPERRWLTESVLRVDGQRGFGPVVGFAAVDAVIERAKTTGVALAAVNNSNHIGMLAPYIERMADAGHIGIALTTSEALVHPWGGATAMVGTNPIGIAVPTVNEPLVLDMSTASVSMGKVLDYAAKAQPIPLGWAVDEFGEPTTDAEAATRGAVSPFGGPKGYALGIALEVLVATLSESALGTDVRGTLDIEEVCSKGDVFVSISLERLGLTGILPRLTAYFDDVRASPRSGVEPLTIPGDRARELRAIRLEDGIPLHRDVWARTLELHQEADDD
jgi:L-2-hydroxycarboxylate dehydrogenase (NAD+)